MILVLADDAEHRAQLRAHYPHWNEKERNSYIFKELPRCAKSILVGLGGAGVIREEGIPGDGDAEGEWKAGDMYRVLCKEKQKVCCRSVVEGVVHGQDIVRRRKEGLWEK